MEWPCLGRRWRVSIVLQGRDLWLKHCPTLREMVSRVTTHEEILLRERNLYLEVEEHALLDRDSICGPKSQVLEQRNTELPDRHVSLRSVPERGALAAPAVAFVENVPDLREGGLVAERMSYDRKTLRDQDRIETHLCLVTSAAFPVLIFIKVGEA